MAKTEKTVKELRQEKREQEEKERLKKEKKEQRAQAVAISTPADKRKRILIAVSVFLTVVILTICIVMIVQLSNPYRDSKFPVAVITMSDKRKLVFQLHEDEAPVAVAVFHYYAYHGYYNGTIIDSITGGDGSSNGDNLKMGGYTESRALLGEQAIVKMLQKNGKFNQPSYTFYMKDDTASNRSCNVLGALSTIKVSSSFGASAEFQISAAESGSSGSGASSGRVFGSAYDQKTKNNLLYYKTLKKVSGTNYVQTDSVVKIKNIKFYNASGLKKHVNYNDDFKSNFVNHPTRY